MGGAYGYVNRHVTDVDIFSFPNDVGMSSAHTENPMFTFCSPFSLPKYI